MGRRGVSASRTFWWHSENWQMATHTRLSCNHVVCVDETEKAPDSLQKGKTITFCYSHQLTYALVDLEHQSILSRQEKLRISANTYGAPHLIVSPLGP